MICEACEGEGYVRGQDAANPGALVMLPCLECYGSGIASCCDAAGSSSAVPAAEGGQRDDDGRLADHAAPSGLSPAIKRLVEEVRNGDGATTGYNRVYNRHNRS